MDIYLIAQFVGIAAVTASLAIFQVNKRRTMLWIGMGGGMLYAIHFFLLGAFTGAAMNFLSVGRCYVFAKFKPERRNTWILWSFIGAAGIATLLTWQGPLSLLPFFGSSANAIAFWQKKPKAIRRWSLIPPPLWFTYNALSGSYPGMFIELITAVSILVGAHRFDHRHKSHIKRHLARPA